MRRMLQAVVFVGLGCCMLGLGGWSAECDDTAGVVKMPGRGGDVNAASVQFAMTEIQEQVFKKKSTVEFLEIIGRLGDDFRGRDEELVKGIFQYVEKEPNLFRAMVAMRVFDVLATNKENIIAVAAHYLCADNEANAKVWRAMMDYGASGGGNDPFGPLRGFLNGPKCAGDGKLMQCVVAYLFERDMEKALDAMLAVARVEREREDEIEWMAHLVAVIAWRDMHKRPVGAGERDEAMGLLKRSVGAKEWWVRLYVVNVVKSHPRTFGEVDISSLGKDENEEVRYAAGGDNPPPPSRSRRSRPAGNAP